MTTQQISKRTVSTTKTYDKEGNLVMEETYEEIEYVPAPSTLPQPWVVTNSGSAGYPYDQPLRSPLTLDPPGPVKE